MRVIVLVRQLSNKNLTANQSMLRYDRMSRAIRAELTSFHPAAGADAVPALAYCRIGQADGMEVV